MKNILKKSELEEKYLQAKEKYYLGQPIMSDSEFDEIENILRQLNSKVIENVGSKLNSKYRAEIKHPTKMLSLDKCHSTTNNRYPNKEFNTFFKDNLKNTSFIVEPKYDGNAINVVYENGLLKHILTRGDGQIGFDITEFGINLNGIPNKIDNSMNGIVEIRGEAIIKDSIFNDKYKEKFSNSRNFVAGILNSKTSDINVLKDIDFVAYEMYQNSNMVECDMFEFFKNNNFIPCFYKNYHQEIVSDDFLSSVFDYFENYKNNECPYQLDGFVIKLSSNEDRMKLGENDHHPKWALAVKFVPESITTKIEKITWNKGKTGSMTPIIFVEPTNLQGSLISKVSGHNIKWLQDKKIRPGITVSLVKSGDIIPQIVDIIDYNGTEEINWFEYFKDMKCPDCGKTYKITENSVICENDDCPSNKLTKFISSFKVLGIKSIGDSLLTKIFNGGIQDIFDIFDLEKLANALTFSKITKNTKNKVIEQIKNIKELEGSKILQMMQIEHLGKTVSKQISKMIFNEPYKESGLPKDIVQKFTNGIEKKKFQEIIDNLKKYDINVISE